MLRSVTNYLPMQCILTIAKCHIVLWSIEYQIYLFASHAHKQNISANDRVIRIILYNLDIIVRANYITTFYLGHWPLVHQRYFLQRDQNDVTDPWTKG